MRHVLSTAIVALVVGSVAGATVSALAQEPESVAPSAVSNINAHRVDGFHAVGAGASRATRAGKLVATNRAGLLPSNIVRPTWNLIEGIPKGFADGVDDGITKVTITRVSGSMVTVGAGLGGSATAECPPGARAVGGGFSAGTSNPPKFWILSSRANAAGRWHISGMNTSEAFETEIQAHVVCLSTTPSTALATAR